MHKTVIGNSDNFGITLEVSLTSIGFGSVITIGSIISFALTLTCFGVVEPSTPLHSSPSKEYLSEQNYLSILESKSFTSHLQSYAYQCLCARCMFFRCLLWR